MTENTVSLKILQVAHILQQKIIYLTGGTNNDGHPLVVCKTANPSFVSSDDIKLAVKYLLYMAKLLWKEDVKFVILLDSQHGKWNHAKFLLQLIEASFAEEQVNKIFMLKPQSFLQRHFGSTDSKQINQDCPFEVILLDGSGQLYDYFDQTQLPEEYGGIDSFDIAEWVEYTTAIERFQQTCQKARQRLIDVEMMFSDKIPQPSVDHVELLFKQQRQLVDDIGNDIDCALTIAETLSPIVNKPLSHHLREPSPLERYNTAQFNVTSDQLNTYKEKLDKEWDEQLIYLDQAKELCTFEEHFGEESKKLLQITSILDARSDIPDSLRTAKDLMLELDDFERKQKDSYKEMTKLKEKGFQMLAVFGDFAKVSIKYRCEEIKVLLKDFEEKLEARRSMLQIALDVYSCLDQVENWCKTGVDLLAAQPVEHFNREEGAKKCLLEIDSFMKSNKGVNWKKINQLTTLCKKLNDPSIEKKIQDELSRVNDVTNMLEKRERSLKKVAMKPIRPVQPVKALSFSEPPPSPVQPAVKKTSVTKSPLTINPPSSPALTKENIAVVVTDDIEKYKRNKTFRKSLRMSMKRPPSSPAQLKLAESREDPQHRKKIRQVITELIQTEEVYVNDLKCVIEGYYTEFDDPSFDIPAPLRAKKHVIFGNIVDIYKFHSSVFLEELRQCNDAPYMAGQKFLDKKEEFQMYADYCKNKPKSEVLRVELHTTTFLKECQAKLGHQLNLDSYLLKPVQRITKYQLLLTEMLKYVSKTNPAHIDILDALHSMKKVLRRVNDVMHSSGLIGFPGNLDDQGKLLYQDMFTVWEGKKNMLKPLTKLNGKNRQVFLFEKSIIFSKKEYENGKELGTYLFKTSLNTADIGVTESVRGDVCRFEVWIQRKSKAFVLQAENLEVKNNWLNEIRKILMLQFEDAKVETIKRRSSKDELADNNNLSQLEVIFEKMPNKSLDSSLSSSQPILSNIEEEDVFNSDELKNQQDNSSKHLSTHSMDENLYELKSDIEDTDEEGWTDSEFEEEEDEETNISDSIQHKQYTITIAKSPTSPPPICVNTFIATADFSSFEHGELVFEKGDLLNLIREGHDGWWFCKHLKTKTEGWAPSGYLDLFVKDVTTGGSVKSNKEREEKTSQQSKDSSSETSQSLKSRLETTV